jgi:DNA repair protein RadD
MTDSSRPIQAASVQTLMRKDIPAADLVFIDEAHRWFSRVNGMKRLRGPGR